MSHEQTTEPDSLSERLEDVADRTRDRFVAELRSGGNPRIEDFLNSQDEVVRSAILRALILAERDWLLERGETPDSRDLRSRFPDHGPLIDEILGSNDTTATAPYNVRINGDVGIVSEAAGSVGEVLESQRRYETIIKHAEGGLGVVNLARDQELHRDVALKEIQPKWAFNEEYRARFLREAEVTARLEHPGIVPVYGIGHHDDGCPYYVMRFIRGETLKDALKRFHEPETGSADESVNSGKTRYTLTMLVGRFIDACHALAYAHDRKVLHRDIKPGNIMLGPYGETLVVDWGLAKTIDDPESHAHAEEGTLRPESDSQMTPTRIGSKIGTIGYMSPEQAAGSLAELRPTSDIYSLGVTLYYLITGHAPFAGARRKEFLKRVRLGDFRRPSEVTPDVSRALEAICLRAMALRPVDRYPTAEALAEDLERWRAGEPVEAYPEPPLDRIARWSRKHRTGLAVAVALLVSTTIGLAGLADQEHREKERISESATIAREAEARALNEKQIAQNAREAAIEDRAAAQKDLKLTRESLRQLMEGLSGPMLTYLPNSGGPRLTMAMNVLKFYQDLSEKHPADSDVKYEMALACRITANIARSVGLYERAEGLYVQSIDLLKILQTETPGSDDYRIELALSTIENGDNFRMSGRPREAEARQLRALEILEPGSGSGSDSIGDERSRRIKAIACLNLASARLEMSRPLEALSQAQKAAALFTTLTEKARADLLDRVLLVFSLINRAIAAGEIDRCGESRQILEEAAQIIREVRQTPENDSPDVRFAEALITSRQARLFAIENRHADSLKSYDAAYKQFADIYNSSFRPTLIERELAVAWLGRAEARLELVGPQPSPDQLKLIEIDLGKARGNLVQLVNNWPNHYEYHGLLGHNHAAYGRLAQIHKQQPQAIQSHKEALEQLTRACELNPDNRRYRESKEKVGEELKRLQASAPAAP